MVVKQQPWTCGGSFKVSLPGFGKSSNSWRLPLTKKYVHLAALGALKSAILEDDNNGLWDYLPSFAQNGGSMFETMEDYTSVDHLWKEIQSFSDHIRKIIQFLETSTDKKNVRLAALGALLSAILEDGCDGNFCYICTVLISPRFPIITVTSHFNIGATGEESILPNEAPIPAPSHRIPAEYTSRHTQLKGRQLRKPSPTLKVPSGGDRFSRRASRKWPPLSSWPVSEDFTPPKRLMKLSALPPYMGSVQTERIDLAQINR
ncbi:hypothetical protein RUND412_003040 [Rhizina undulata]